MVFKQMPHSFNGPNRKILWIQVNERLSVDPIEMMRKIYAQKITDHYILVRIPLAGKGGHP